MERDAKSGTAGETQRNGGVAGKIIKIPISDSASEDEVKGLVYRAVDMYQLRNIPIAVLVYGGFLNISLCPVCPICEMQFMSMQNLADHYEYFNKYGTCMVS